MVLEVGQPDALKKTVYAAFIKAMAIDGKRRSESDIFAYGKPRKQCALLKNDASIRRQ